nr:hypothetical protein [uncultured Flavobacterium sp.]
MKKILTLFAVVGLFAFSGCSDDDNDVDYDTISYVFEVNNVTFDSNGNTPVIDFDTPILSGDVVLMYRLNGTVNGRDVWSPIPQSYYYDDGTLHFTYKFNFTQDDIDLYLEGFELNTVSNAFRLNQTFRVVIVPGDDGVNTNKSVNKPDYSDYYQVIKKYNIDDSNVKKLN